MNATLVNAFASPLRVGGIELGAAFEALTLLSEGALLFVAAQSGLSAGPAVMATMAIDSWLPRPLSALSEQLTIRNGIYLMGGSALAVLLYARGNVHVLVVMYSINVFLTFLLSSLAMTRDSLAQRRARQRWKSSLLVHGFAAALCAGVLAITAVEKFSEGGWVTLIVTSAVIALACAVRAHYREVTRKIALLDQTAGVLVGGYSGLGLHTLMQIQQIFPGLFRQAVLISAAIVDSAAVGSSHEVDVRRARTQRDLERYMEFARARFGWAVDWGMALATDPAFELERLCRHVDLRFPRSVFFAGQLVVRQPTWWYRLLHNDTAFAVQRRLQYDRLPMVILPTRMLA